MLKNVRVGVKIFTGFTVVILCIMIVSYVGFDGLTSVIQRVDGLEIVNNIVKYMLEARVDEKSFIIYGDLKYISRVRYTLYSLETQVDTIKESFRDSVNKEQMDEVLSAIGKYKNFFDEYLKLKEDLEYDSSLLAINANKVQEIASELMRKTGRTERTYSSSASRLTELFLESRQDEESFIRSGEISFINNLDEKLEDITRLAQGMKTSATQISDIKKIDSLIATIQEYKRIFDEVVRLKETVSIVENEMEGAAKNAEEISHQIHEGQKSRMENTISMAKKIMITSSAAAVFIGFMFAFIITRRITKPVSRCVTLADTIATGDLTKHITVDQKDEMGQMAKAMNQMSTNLRDMALRVLESADQLALTSEDITMNAQHLAEGSQNQASTLEETSASVEELTSSVEQVAEHAQSQAVAVNESIRNMEQVQQSINEVSGTLDRVSELSNESVTKASGGTDAVVRVAEAITSISESSGKISGIVGVISDIAEQTNLLALNASIEAARAGEHGRGFAVVADEVSKLADRSAASAKEIEVLIQESERVVKESVERANSSSIYMKEIIEGAQAAFDMITALSTAMERQVTAIQKMAEALQNISDMSESISAATEEQTTNAKHVSRAIENVNEVTQQTASGAEQMNASTEELAGMARQLQELMAQFKVREQGEGKETMALAELEEEERKEEGVEQEDESEEVSEVTLKEDERFSD